MTSIVSFDYDLDYNDPSVYSFVVIPHRLSLGAPWMAEYAAKRSDYGNKTEDVFTKQASSCFSRRQGMPMTVQDHSLTRPWSLRRR